jgi:hypothetical protein
MLQIREKLLSVRISYFRVSDLMIDQLQTMSMRNIAHSTMLAETNTTIMHPMFPVSAHFRPGVTSCDVIPSFRFR